MRCGPGDSWRDLEQVNQPDPAFVRLHERDRGLQSPFRGLPAPGNCTHLWRGALPEDLPAGTHAIEVLATDLFGNQHEGLKPVRVVA
jgi:hypothetical protein